MQGKSQSCLVNMNPKSQHFLRPIHCPSTQDVFKTEMHKGCSTLLNCEELIEKYYCSLFTDGSEW